MADGRLTERQRQRLQERLAQIARELDAVAVHGEALLNRERIELSTWEAGKVAGSNVYDDVQKKYPWQWFHRRIADYLDQPRTKPKGIYPVSVARGHLKSEIACVSLARHVCMNPETRNAILSGTDERSTANLFNVCEILKSDEFQKAYPDRLFPPNTREAYTTYELTVKHKGKYREPTVKACSILGNTTGMHVGEGSVLMADDVVSKQNYVDKPEERTKVRNALIHYLSFVVDPGALIWLTHTRWGLDDAYATVLDPQGAWSHYIEPGAVCLGCFLVDNKGELQQAPNGDPRPLYPLKYCWEVSDSSRPVIVNGTVFHTPRESLKIKKETMEAWEWNSQMLNDPQPEGQVVFKPEYFENTLPCKGRDLETFLDDPENVKKYITPPTDPALAKTDLWHDRGHLVAAIAGDPSYEDKGHNDYQVLLLVLQDRWNNWYVCEAYRARDGYTGLEKYLRLAMDWRDAYRVQNAVGIESHGTQKSIIPVADGIARHEQREPLRWAKLPANSNQKKHIRIARVEPQFRGGRVYWCSNVNDFRVAARDEMTRFGAGQAHDDIGDAIANLMDPEVLQPRSADEVITEIDFAPSARQYNAMRRAG